MTWKRTLDTEISQLQVTCRESRAMVVNRTRFKAFVGALCCSSEQKDPIYMKPGVRDN